MTQAIDHTMTTTAFSLEGYRTTRTLGIVRGITVRSRSVLGTLGAGLQTLIGGNITILTELCEKTREEAFELMLEHAQQLGANASDRRGPGCRSARDRSERRSGGARISRCAGFGTARLKGSRSTKGLSDALHEALVRRALTTPEREDAGARAFQASVSADRRRSSSSSRRRPAFRARTRSSRRHRCCPRPSSVRPAGTCTADACDRPFR
jgi:uncharacterized protein YbjQ (UPF0145 family)